MRVKEQGMKERDEVRGPSNGWCIDDPSPLDSLHGFVCVMWRYSAARYGALYYTLK